MLATHERFFVGITNVGYTNIIQIVGFVKLGYANG
jgi:hypothetical protein